MLNNMEVNIVILYIYNSHFHYLSLDFSSSFNTFEALINVFYKDFLAASLNRFSTISTSLHNNNLIIQLIIK